MFFHGLFIKVIGFPFHHVKGILRAFPETGAETVAVFFRRQAGLAINDLNGSLGARRNTLSAAVAFFFIYLYYFTFDFHFLSAFSYLNHIPISSSPGVPRPAAGDRFAASVRSRR